MNIQLSDRFTYGKLFRFTLPSVVMMVFTSIYGVVDGFFVSNFVGKTSFAAVNFIFPFLMILGTVGFMFGAGGSALIARTMGEGDNHKAQRLFSLFVYVTAGCGVVLGLIGFVFIRPIAAWLGAEGEMLENCVLYGRIILPVLPALMLQYEFQSFFITAEKPQLGLMVTVIAGVANMVLDALFTAVLPFGLAGAASATAISQALGGIIPLFYFGRRNSSRLRLCKTSFDGRALLKACTNGSSELMSNISMSIVSMLYNAQLIRYAGEDGIAAYGVLMYVSMIFMAIFIGYSTGVAPVVGYHFGADNRDELRSLYRKSTVIILASSAAMLGLAEVLARPLSTIFVGYDPVLFDITVSAFGIYSFSFLFSGIAIFGSAFFTALNDGLTSALISFLRTLVFQVAAVLIFPLIWGLDGIWLSIVAAEVMAAVVTLAFLIGKRKKFHY
ncbi:MATE family efflux transporter [Acutalibacter sp. 1XD8-36]|uniref:MATE family efflux transporter n=1 Tax=Acutalibacter sp. 1XD8-36 TaxID=2320852 RepID=UPI001413558D|nr:MATE family efflux transporter [Acutalibacter sp. 1XD8-36]NBJ90087.1 MATE family efflux transporter [Acutalibacter sp. 1XD8-36]